VPDFARRLAAGLGLPFVETLEKREHRPEQKTMENSARQLQNVLGSFDIRPGEMPAGPVLLVDDIVDSRWTMTFAAYLLRKHGSGVVYPYALALAAPRA
jgi:ATP-dependent DNA helicase RecQ